MASLLFRSHSFSLILLLGLNAVLSSSNAGVDTARTVISGTESLSNLKGLKGIYLVISGTAENLFASTLEDLKQDIESRLRKEGFYLFDRRASRELHISVLSSTSSLEDRSAPVYHVSSLLCLIEYFIRTSDVALLSSTESQDFHGHLIPQYEGQSDDVVPVKMWQDLRENRFDADEAPDELGNLVQDQVDTFVSAWRRANEPGVEHAVVEALPEILGEARIPGAMQTLIDTEQETKEIQRAIEETKRIVRRSDRKSPKISFENKGDKDILIKLRGPTRALLFIPAGRKITFSVRAGDYHCLAKLGLGNEATYLKGEEFSVKSTRTGRPAPRGRPFPSGKVRTTTTLTVNTMTITFGAGRGGAYQSTPISKKGFDDG